MTGECRWQLLEVSSPKDCSAYNLLRPAGRKRMRREEKNENHQSNWRRRSNEAAQKQEAPDQLVSTKYRASLLSHFKRKSHRDHHNTLFRTLVTTTLLLLLPLPSNQVLPSARTITATSNKQQLLGLFSRLPHSNGGAFEEAPPEEVEQISRPLPLLSAPGGGGQHQHSEAPKIIPLSALERYQEGAELKLFCSASAPASAGRLHFEWRKGPQPEQPASFFQGDQPQQQPSPKVLQSNGKNIHISMMDDSSSLLRLGRLEAEDSGNYTCFARNQHGVDSSSVRVNVNVRLKWLREPPSEIQIKAGKSVQLECDATGQPAPLISWTSLKDRQTINSKLLRIDRAQLNDSGLYECLASTRAGAGHRPSFLATTSGQEGEGENFLRKLVKLIVNGK